VLERRNTVDLGLGSPQEHVTEAEGNRPGNDRQLQIEQVRNGSDSPSNHRAHSAPFGFRRLGRRNAQTRRDRGTARLCLEHAASVPGQLETVGFDDDMTDMAGVAIGPVEQATSQDDAPAHPGGHHHREIVAHPNGCAKPPFGERKRLCIVVDVGDEPCLLAETLLQREVAPHGDIERRDGCTSPTHRTPAPNATGHFRLTVVAYLRSDARNPSEQLFGIERIGRGNPSPADNRPLGRHDARLDLRPTDVDRKDAAHCFDPTAHVEQARSPARVPTGGTGRLSFRGTSESGGSVVTSEHTAEDPAATGRDHGASPGFAEHFDALTRNISKAIRGKDTIIHLMTLALVADGHVLVEDVPGVGKTSLGKALARSVDGRFGRVQFTPDLLPTDVTGVSVWNRSANAFEFRPGPVFANILLADEINRASPKTQSALLEAMAERQVTADGATHHLAAPFMVIATQNPIEHEGTYALPEAQLDRFLMRLEIGYPDRRAELEILESHGDRREPSDLLGPVVTADQVVEMSASLERVYLAPALQSYLLDLADATRRHPSLSLGLSPRGVLALQRVVRAHAASERRAYATPDDVKYLADYVLPHRLLVTPEARMRGTRPADVVTEILAGVPIPRPGGS